MPAPPEPSDPLAFDPADCRGKNALLIVFGPSIKSPAVQMQLDLLQGVAAGFRSRGLRVARLLFEGESSLDDRRVAPASAAQVRGRYGLASDAFFVLLLDREGNELRRYDSPVKPEALLDVLDGAGTA